MCPPRSSARSVGPAGARGGRQVVLVGFPGPHEDADQLFYYEFCWNFYRISRALAMDVAIVGMAVMSTDNAEP